MAEPAMRTRKAACGLRIRISLRSSRVTPFSPAGEPKLIATRERGVEAETVPRSRSMGLDPLAVHERFVADHFDHLLHGGRTRSSAAVTTQRQGRAQAARRERAPHLAETRKAPPPAKTGA